MFPNNYRYFLLYFVRCPSIRIPITKITNIILHNVYDCFVAGDLLLYYNVQYVDTRFRGRLFLRFLFLISSLNSSHRRPIYWTQSVRTTQFTLLNSATQNYYTEWFTEQAHFLPLPIFFIITNLFKIWCIEFIRR